MSIYDWLDAWPDAPRGALLAGTATLLVTTSAGLPLAGLEDAAHDAAVVATGLLLVVGWGVAWRVAGPPWVSPDDPDGDDAAVRHRGLLAGRWLEEAHGAASLPEVDPDYSLLEWTRGIRRALAGHLDGAIGPVTVLGAEGDVVKARALHRSEGGGLAWVEVRLARQGDRFTVLSHALRAGPLGAVEVEPGLPAARRALLARDEALDGEAFAVLFAQVNEELDRLASAGETSDGTSAYLTDQGADALRFWVEGPGLPTAGGDPVWISVEEDAWHERIEVQCGLRVLGMCRRAGRRDAPWQLWRIRRGA